MSALELEPESYLAGRWIGPGDGARALHSAVTGERVGRAGGGALDAGAALEHARRVGGPALRALGFHDRARLLKALATHLDAHKGELHRLSHVSGATLADARVDIDGGIGTLFVYASKGRRELPDARVLPDGGVEQLSRDGSFVGRHVRVPKAGVAVHVNAFNFPVWGMLEKLAQSLLAGVPAIVKPATTTAYVAEACFRRIVDSGTLPEGAVQLVVGSTGDLLSRLDAQDTVAFTGSAETALALRAEPGLIERGTTFLAEQDSLNGSLLGPDAVPGTPEFSLFVDEVCREMTVKAGQKCTAIRRIVVPASSLDAVAEAIAARLGETVVGDPALEATTMGALVSQAQREDVRGRIGALRREAGLVCGGDVPAEVVGADAGRGAFLAPTLLLCRDPDGAREVHRTEAFGPVATLMPCEDPDHGAALLNRGGGSLVASLITHDPEVARRVAKAIAPWHGRLYVNDRDSMGSATGHGAPLPHMIHGGPGRAGGGEELGGVRGVMHYLRRTAIQGSPRMVAAVAGHWQPGAPTRKLDVHPFRLGFDALVPGDTHETGPRTVALEDIEHFARFTGDTFYAHMDEAAAAANPFFGERVAHGYLLLAFAAGLFVDPDPGPVLANTGLDGLEFTKPVPAGGEISVTLTVAGKTRRTDDYGEVRWHVAIEDGAGDAVASYQLRTMNAYAA